MGSEDLDPRRASPEVCWRMPSVVSRADSALPAIDDRLVTPETRYEMHDGELVYVSPADPPHGERHVQLAALIEAHTDGALRSAPCDR